MEIEAAVWNEWYPVAVVQDLKDGSHYRTRILGCEIAYGRDAAGVFSAHLADGSGTPCCRYPVARADDLPLRHVFHGQLHGIELALWRADDGHVNAWENRCPHRSVRFTLGMNTGEKLRCQYHGWQYRSGDGRCTFIPATSATAPPASLCARTFAAAEANGYDPCCWSVIVAFSQLAAPGILWNDGFDDGAVLLSCSVDTINQAERKRVNF